MNPGKQLIDAIKAHADILRVADCPGASVAIGKAVYGGYQDDGTGREIKPGISRGDLNNIIRFDGTYAQTAVWHFATDPVHHFVVVPWYNQSPPGWSYSVFMAYEHQYTIREYIQSAPGRMSQSLNKGYREEWSITEVVDMLLALLDDKKAWGKYFLHGVDNEVKSITCYKYDVISIDKALANLKK
jgi:hypothetical protein